MAESAPVFMKVTRKAGGTLIKGDSKVRMGNQKDYREWIELDDWRWDLRSHDRNDEDGAGDAALLGETRKLAPGKKAAPPAVIEPSILSLSKLMDSSSTELLGAMLTGELLTIVIAVEDYSPDLFDLTLTLEDARIANYEVSSRVGDKELSISEEWEIDYASITFDYRLDIKTKSAPVTLKRHANASREAPARKESQLLALAREFDRSKLDEIWAQILVKLDQEGRGTVKKDKVE
jgi:type VI protein secretion system component Hcp